MSGVIPVSPRRGNSDFQAVNDAFLRGDGLPFADLLPAEQIEEIFARHHCTFGRNRIYSAAIVLWSFMSQCLQDGKGASCQSAVARIVAYSQERGLDVPTSDTGDYCRARAKLSLAAVRDLTIEHANNLEDRTVPAWLWKGKHHVKLVDGFTFTMPDTPENQAEYPQLKSQKPGIGFPIARAVIIISMATACAMNVEMGPYSGKETGESALLRKMLDSFQSDDIVVADRFYCSYMMIALLLTRGAQVCVRKHQSRHTDFRKGKRLGKNDHLVTWVRPSCPEWMDEETYALIPEALTLREIRTEIAAPGKRTKVITVITTLVDHKEHTKAEIVQLYGFRWNSELDIRSIKSNLNLEHARCKTPKMVRLELWVTLLGYNLIRTTAAAAALLHKKQPRQISFTSTCQYVLATWMQLSTGQLSREKMRMLALRMLEQIANCKVGHRPNRIEPRALKRRKHGYPLMQKPRQELRQELHNQCT